MTPAPAPTATRTRSLRVAAQASRYAVFSRAAQQFGLPVEFVREVLPGQPLTRVPRAQSEILGVLSLRGEILPVVAIDRWLRLPFCEDNPAHPILVLRRSDLLVGLRVDAIRTVLNISPESVQPHPDTGADAHFAGIWHVEGLPPITLIAGQPLLDALCHFASENP